jgi:hypothetical protein
MEQNWKGFKKPKFLFSSHYCLECKQTKPCQILSHEYCCSCFCHQERTKAQEYTNYQQVYQKKVTERKKDHQQLKLLWEYQGCLRCGSKEVDAYEFLEHNQLVCQPCLVQKTSQSSSPISFSKQSQWYQKHWKIKLEEWFTAYNCLPVNAKCAREWLKNKQHLKNCQCLELEAKEMVELFTNSLKKIEEKSTKCQCKTSEKVRVDSDYYTWCKKCEKSIPVASKKRVIKNRNYPTFWGLNVREKVLCGNCLENKKGEMTPLRRAKFNEYKKLGRL